MPHQEADGHRGCQHERDGYGLEPKDGTGSAIGTFIVDTSEPSSTLSTARGRRFVRFTPAPPGEFFAVYRTPSDLRHDDADVRDGVRDAIRFSVGVAVAAVVFFVVAAVWVSTCGGSTADTVACGTPQRTLLGLGAPTILLLGGIRAFVRTYRAWRRDGVWWPWQGAGWFLLTAMLLVLTTSLPTISGL